MIKRHLTAKQREALECLKANGIIYVTRATRAAAHQLAYATLCYLRREKLVVIGASGAYELTEAGAAALESGLYEKQPQVLVMRTSLKVFEGNKAHQNAGHPGRSA